MDPSIFLQYSPPNGLPQESKLATYMNRSTSTPTRNLNQAMGKLSLESSPTAIKKFNFQNRSTSTPTRNLNQAMGMLSLESSPTAIKKPFPQVLIGEFMPVNYYTPFLPDSPESSPPSTLANLQGTLQGNHQGNLQGNLQGNIPGNIQQNTQQVHQENVGGTTYFYSTNDSMNSTGGLNASAPMGQPEQCLGVVGPGPAVPSPYATQMYAGTPTHMGPITQTKPGLAATFYMPDTIRQEIYQRNEEVFLQTDLRQFPDLPENVEMYSELTPIECTPHSLASSYRATHRQSGEHYALRRLHSYSNVATKRLEMWKNIDHPNVVRLHECFTTKAFGDHSMVLVYDFHPACVTVMNKYLSGGSSAPGEGNTFHDPFSSDPDAPRPYTHQKNAMLRAVACGALLPEAVLWSLLVQLTAALRAIHTAGLACRNLDPTKVVMNGCRVRVAWCGVADSLHTNTNDVGQAQQEDLTALGRLALALACRTVHCDNLPASMDLVARTYSADLKNLILYLLSTSPARRSVTDLMPMIGARFYTQVEALERRADAFEEQLAREIDNGRLLRILIKLGVVNERPELNMDRSWSETGDRYMLKLFRDYLFHSVGADGRPWLDYAHLAHCLNQLDGGTATRVELMSRDEQSVLVVSYAELKHCLEQSFDEVTQAASSSHLSSN